MVTQPPPPTRRGLLPEARHVVLPAGIAASGFPRVRETCRKIGVEFDSWQTDLNRCILGKTSDGLYAADTVVLSIARQVGKTFNVGALVFAECIAEPGTTVIWTAHRFKVARETFNELRGLAKSPKLAPHIDYDAITTAAGNECIPFRNGSRIVFAARERGAIRGFTKVRILVLDEGQILTHSTLADLAPTMNQAANPLILIMGTPPKPSDPGEVFSELRAEALEQFEEHGHSEGILYVEFSAKPGSDPDDRQAWRDANPSYPKRTPARAILRLKKLLSAEDFLREALGIWDTDRARSVIPAGAWTDARDVSSTIDGAPRFAVDVAPLDSWGAIVAAGYRADGLPHVEVTSTDDGATVDHRPGIDWIVPRLADMVTRWPAMKVVLSSAAKSLRPEIEALGVEVEVLGQSDVAAACGLFYTKATTGALRHLGQEALTTAAVNAIKRDIGEGGPWVWGRKRSPIDITPLYGATLALWSLMDDEPGDVSVFSTGDLDKCDACGVNPHDDPDGEHNYLCAECRDLEA